MGTHRSASRNHQPSDRLSVACLDLFSGLFSEPASMHDDLEDQTRKIKGDSRKGLEEDARYTAPCARPKPARKKLLDPSAGKTRPISDVASPEK